MEKKSDLLTNRIREAESEIADLEARLVGIGEERTALLGSDTVDAKSLTRLEGESQKATATIDAQRSRLMLLGEQVESAERVEAGARVLAIEAEHNLIRQRMEARHTEWREHLGALLTILKESGVDRQQLRVLAEESAYLVERYSVSHASLPPPPFLSQDDLATTLTNEFRKGAWALHATSPWKQRSDEIRQKRNALATAAIDTRRQRLPIKMNVPAPVR